jgi:NitT/TauT family transport system substrate-binding protein
MSIGRPLAQIACLFLVLQGLAACTTSNREPLRIGVNAWPAFDLLWIAQHEGYFEAENVAVRLLDFEGLADSRLALDRGMLDGICTTATDLAFSRVKPRAVWVFDRSLGADALVAGPTVRDLADLRGRRIGLEPDSVNRLVLQSALRSVGLDLSDVQLQSMGQLVAEEQFRAGELDAVITYPPVLSRLQEVAGSRRLYDSSQMSSPIYDLIAFRAEVIEARADDIAAVQRAYWRALQLYQQRPDYVIELLRERQHADAEVAASAFAGLRFYAPAEQAALVAPGGPVDQAIEYARALLPPLPEE